MQFDFSTLASQDVYKLLASTITPRPIAWITSHDRAFRLNAAPFSFFNVFSADPPILGIGIGRRPDVTMSDGDPAPKDSWANISATREFVVHLVDEASATAMNWTATPFPPGESEPERAGIKTLPSTHIAVPRIASSPVAFECVLHQEIPLGERNMLVLGRVLAMHIRDDAIINAERKHIDTEKLGLIARVGGAGGYIRCTDVFQMQRLTLDAWEQGNR